MAVYEHATRRRAYVYTCVRVRVRVCVRECVRVCVCEERDKHHFQDNTIFLLRHHLIYALELISKVMWDYVSCFKYTCDVAARGASTARIIDESYIFTYDGGYTAQSYSSANGF